MSTSERPRQQILEIDEVTTGALLSMGTSPTYKFIVNIWFTRFVKNKYLCPNAPPTSQTHLVALSLF